MNQPGHLLSSDGLVAMQQSWTSKGVTQRRQQTKRARAVGNAVYCVRKKINMPVREIEANISASMQIVHGRDTLLFHTTGLTQPHPAHTKSVCCCWDTPEINGPRKRF
jgi:hypothetical protein